MNERESWIEAQVHIHRHSPFGSVGRIYGWTTVSWGFAGRSCTVAFAEWPDSPELPIEFEGDFFIETEHDEAPEGYELAYELPCHNIPTSEDFLKQFTYEDPYWVEYVNHDNLEDFAHVQDQAYTEVYSYPQGLGKSFYLRPESVIGENIIASIMYHDQLPVRVAYALRFGNIVQGVGGAVIPQFRGKHLGEALWADIGAYVAGAWGIKHVFHVSMPSAVPIMNRHPEIQQVATYRRWKRVAG